MIIKILENGKIKLNERIFNNDDYTGIIEKIKKEMKKNNKD
jgi:hypothetical protein